MNVLSPLFACPCSDTVISLTGRHRICQSFIQLYISATIAQFLHSLQARCFRLYDVLQLNVYAVFFIFNSTPPSRPNKVLPQKVSSISMKFGT